YLCPTCLPGPRVHLQRCDSDYQGNRRLPERGFARWRDDILHVAAGRISLPLGTERGSAHVEAKRRAVSCVSCAFGPLVDGLCRRGLASSGGSQEQGGVHDGGTDRQYLDGGDT